MNPQDPLSKLNPLREPDLVSWWPPAPGWWLLLAVVLLALALCLYLGWRYYRRNAYRRRALKQLQEIRQRYRQDTPGGAMAINALLKAVALHAYPRREVAASSGAQWLAFLNNALQSSQQLGPDYIDAIYRKDSQPPDLDAICASAASWIRRHKGAGR